VRNWCFGEKVFSVHHSFGSKWVGLPRVFEYESPLKIPLSVGVKNRPHCTHGWAKKRQGLSNKKCFRNKNIIQNMCFSLKSDIIFSPITPM
jgi:hypothetical protein